MATIATLVLNQNYILNGLGTLTYTVTTAGFVRIQNESSVMTPSGLAIVVQQNGSTVYTAPVLSPTQLGISFQFSFIAAVNDVITVVYSSGAAIDSLLNSVKTNVSIIQGA
jgi:hypothetical protein